MKNNKQIFLSYSRLDSKFVIRLAEDLKENGFTVWMDQSDIRGGRHWDNTIEEALRNSSAVVLVVTPSSASSENVKDEVSFAQSKNLRIIPVIYKNTEIPLRWHRLQFIDIQKDYQRGLQELTASIKGLAFPSEKLPKQNKKKFIFSLLILFVVGFIIFSINRYSQTRASQSKETIHTKNTSMYKGNSIIIGNNNKEINITQH